MCVVNARCWCNRQILWAARRSVQVTEDKPLAILVKGIAEVLHIVFTELDSRKTQAIRKRHSSARLRPSADRNRPSTRISPTRRWPCSHNCCAMALFRIRVGFATWRPGKWRRCRFAQFRHVLNLTKLVRVADYTGVGLDVVQMRPRAGYDLVRCMSEALRVGDTQ